MRSFTRLNRSPLAQWPMIHPANTIRRRNDRAESGGAAAANRNENARLPRSDARFAYTPYNKKKTYYCLTVRIATDVLAKTEWSRTKRRERKEKPPVTMTLAAAKLLPTKNRHLRPRAHARVSDDNPHRP